MNKFEIQYSTLLEDLNTVNKNIKEQNLKNVHITIDFEDDKAIPDYFDIDLSCEFDLVIKGDKLSHIGYTFLDRCDHLTSITLPQNIISIGNHFLSTCHLLKEIELPENLFYVGSWFIQSCKSLTEIKLPKNITYIGDHFLYHTRYSTNIIAPLHLKIKLDSMGIKSGLIYSQPKSVTYYEDDKK